MYCICYSLVDTSLLTDKVDTSLLTDKVICCMFLTVKPRPSQDLHRWLKALCGVLYICYSLVDSPVCLFHLKPNNLYCMYVLIGNQYHIY